MNRRCLFKAACIIQLTIAWAIAQNGKLAGAIGDLKLTLNNPTSPTFDASYGYSLSLKDNLLLVGSLRQGASGVAYLYDVDTGELRHTFESPEPINNNSFGYQLAFLENDILISEKHDNRPGVVYRFDSSTYELENTFTSPLAPRIDTTFGKSLAAPPGKDIVAIGEEGAFIDGTRMGTIHLFNATTNEFQRTIVNPNVPLLAGSTEFGGTLAAGDGFLVAGDRNFREPQQPNQIRGIAYVLDATTGQVIHSLRLPDSYDVYGPGQLGVHVAADGPYLVAADSSRMYMYDARRAELLNILVIPGGSSISSMSFLQGVTAFGSSTNEQALVMEGPLCCIPSVVVDERVGGFGKAIAIGNGKLAVAAQGRVFIYESVATSVPEPAGLALGISAVAVLAVARGRNHNAWRSIRRRQSWFRV